MGYNHGFEAQFLGLGDALLYAGDLTQFATETHLGAEAHPLLYGNVDIRREYCANHRQVEGGVVDFESASDVEEHILLCEFEAHPLFEHSQQHVHAALVKACDRALGSAVGCGAHQCLHLDEEWSRAVDGNTNGGAREFLVMGREQHLAGVGDLAQSRLAHLVDAHLARGAKAVLDRAQDAVHVVAVALKL